MCGGVGRESVPLLFRCMPVCALGRETYRFPELDWDVSKAGREENGYPVGKGYSGRQLKAKRTEIVVEDVEVACCNKVLVLFYLTKKVVVFHLVPNRSETFAEMNVVGSLFVEILAAVVGKACGVFINDIVDEYYLRTFHKT